MGIVEERKIRSEKRISHRERLIAEYQKLKAQGMSRSQICEAMCVAPATLRRWDTEI